mmetsp:Transcript_57604/g.130668  ORF Transcript_57604/g.130668 Transcript_57604/m.130668 type:complete len:356 (+) Transcript_57604:247-1314(+)
MPDWVAHRYEAAELRKFKHRVEGGRRALARPRNAHGVFAAQRVDDGLQEGSWVAANGLTVSRGAAIPRTVDGNVVKAVRDSWSCRSEVCHLLNEQIPHHRAIPLVAPMHIQHQRILGIPDNSREHISKPPSFYPNRPATQTSIGVGGVMQHRVVVNQVLNLRLPGVHLHTPGRRGIPQHPPCFCHVPSRRPHAGQHLGHRGAGQRALEQAGQAGIPKGGPLGGLALGKGADDAAQHQEPQVRAHTRRVNVTLVGSLHGLRPSQVHKGETRGLGLVLPRSGAGGLPAVLHRERQDSVRTGGMRVHPCSSGCACRCTTLNDVHHLRYRDHLLLDRTLSIDAALLLPQGTCCAGLAGG